MEECQPEFHLPWWGYHIGIQSLTALPPYAYSQYWASGNFGKMRTLLSLEQTSIKKSQAINLSTEILGYSLYNSYESQTIPWQWDCCMQSGLNQIHPESLGWCLFLSFVCTWCLWDKLRGGIKKVDVLRNHGITEANTLSYSLSQASLDKIHLLYWKELQNATLI